MQQGDAVNGLAAAPRSQWKSMSMKTVGNISQSGDRSRWAGWLVLAVVVLATERQIADSPASSQVACRRSCQASVASAQTAPLLAGGWWEKYYNAFESSLASRQGMLRFGAVGMLLALFVIWYRK
jgi:hypothetical protein